ncbi:unnamed protein product [Moneuplotes crassus]|uniref:Uncharacterized protein n=1 Tax=Euplotes crassus TaxID=5936 RepID=A0AAD1X9X4_EUPCR|nr:unnamed protein product [Moneuplotes crassus]
MAKHKKNNRRKGHKTETTEVIGIGTKDSSQIILIGRNREAAMISKEIPNHQDQLRKKQIKEEDRYGSMSDSRSSSSFADEEKAPSDNDLELLRKMIAQLQSFSEKSKKGIQEAEEKKEELLSKIDEKPRPLVNFLSNIQDSCKKEEESMLKLQEERAKVELEIRQSVHNLIHPQAKEYYAEETEAKIIKKTIDILMSEKDNRNSIQDIIKSYVLKMKVRNKIGLKLSRWVGYTELSKDLIGNQERIPKLLNHMKDPTNSETKTENNSKLSRSSSKKNKGKGSLQKQEVQNPQIKTSKYVDYFKKLLEKIKKRKLDLKEALKIKSENLFKAKEKPAFDFSDENWQTSIGQSSMIDEMDIKSDLLVTMDTNNLKMKRKCDALSLLSQYLRKHQ